MQIRCVSFGWIPVVWLVVVLVVIFAWSAANRYQIYKAGDFGLLRVDTWRGQTMTFHGGRGWVVASEKFPTPVQVSRPSQPSGFVADSPTDKQRIVWDEPDQR